MVTKRKLAWTAYVLALVVLSVLAFQTGRAGASCNSFCVDVIYGSRQFSNGTIFFTQVAAQPCRLVLLDPIQKGLTCYNGTSHNQQFDNYPYGTPNCSAPIGTLVTATGVSGTPSGSTSYACCNMCF